MEIEDIKIRLAELSEAIKYIDKRLEYHDEELKSLHRENSKQSEEIRDSIYLSDTAKINLDALVKACAECKGCQKEVVKGLSDKLEALKVDIEKASSKKLILIIEVVTGTLISILALVGSIKGWIKLGW
jgi:hypothetical protein